MNFKKSDKVWEWLDRQRMGFSDKKKENGSGLSDRTVAKYKYDFNRLMKLVESETGKTDPMKVKPNDVYRIIDKMVGEYKAGKTANASFLRSIDDSLHAFKEASKASGVFKRELRLGDKKKIQETLNQEKVYRRASDTSVMKATREEVEKVVRELEKSTSPAKEVAIKALKLEFETGRRISAILRSQVGNYDAKSGQYVTYGDKGGKDNESFFLTPGARGILDSVTEDKKDGDMMFKIKYTQHRDPNKIGQDKSVESMRKQVSSLIQSAAKRAGVNRGELTFSSHSCRKGFADERATFYIATMTPEERREELERRKSLDENLSKRIDKVLEHIKSKFKIEGNAKNRDFTDTEITKLLVSTDINHSRIDVMRYYLMDYDFIQKELFLK